MRIVRTVGQAFDVCHQLTLQQTPDEQEDEEGNGDDSEAVPAKKRFALSEETDLEATTEESIECASSSEPERSKKEETLRNRVQVSLESSLLLSSSILDASLPGQLAADPSCLTEHQLQLLEKQLQQQEQQALAASAQVRVLREQLSVEMCARTEAQAHVQRLLQQNTDLLQHISLLVKQIQELELKAVGQLTSMGSQDSLLEITFRAKPPNASRDTLTLSSSSATLSTPSQALASDSAWPSSPGTYGTETSLAGRGGGGIRLECFRFFSTQPEESQEQAQEPGETPSDGGADESSLLGEQVLGALELLRFRESGIGSEYESNTDESDDRESWGQSEGAGADGAARLLNVLNADSLPDCLGDEMAV